jgi:hypothetical protein
MTHFLLAYGWIVIYGVCAYLAGYFLGRSHGREEAS